MIYTQHNAMKHPMNFPSNNKKKNAKIYATAVETSNHV